MNLYRLEGDILVRRNNGFLGDLNINEIARYYRELRHPSNSDGKTTKMDNAKKCADIFGISVNLVLWCNQATGTAGQRKGIRQPKPKEKYHESRNSKSTQ